MNCDEPQNGFSEESFNKLMIIDDEPELAAKTLSGRLARKGYKVHVIKNPDEVKTLSSEEILEYPVFIIDYNMVNIYGDELVPIIREKNFLAYLIVYTGFPNVDKFETLKKFNLIGVDFWAEKGDTETEKELFARVDYAFRRAENIFSPLHLK